MNTQDQVLHLLLSVLYLTFLFERGYYQAKAMRVSGEASKIMASRDRLAATVLLFVVAQAWVIGTFVYLLKPAWMGWTRIPLPSWARWLGVALTVGGMVLEFSTQRYLGRNYATTVHIGEHQTLITNGPYRSIRHPMYTALIITGIGLTLLSASLYFTPPFLGTLLVIIIRVDKEEQAMIEKFGDAYRQYCRKTRRFLPRIRRN